MCFFSLQANEMKTEIVYNTDEAMAILSTCSFNLKILADNLSSAIFYHNTVNMMLTWCACMVSGQCCSCDQSSESKHGPGDSIRQ